MFIWEDLDTHRHVIVLHSNVFIHRRPCLSTLIINKYTYNRYLRFIAYGDKINLIFLFFPNSKIDDYKSQQGFDINRASYLHKAIFQYSENYTYLFKQIFFLFK